ncbi:hypothetical protein N3K66_003223 [Trichothecium roseum]|uniref:Uncharacterized protein n=1 Tax=Trichothecium roseum TaxID=47278 RepID=A0ACC0V4T3_9HYPO|nr:hypothetical protein N3K66_003223 [Trichothecium roseum]
MATLSEGARFTLLDSNPNANASTNASSSPAPIVTPTSLPIPPGEPVGSIEVTPGDSTVLSVTASPTTPVGGIVQRPTNIFRPGPVPTDAESLPDASGVVSDTATDPQVTDSPADEPAEDPVDDHADDDNEEDPEEDLNDSPPVDEPLATDVDEAPEPVPSSDAAQPLSTDAAALRPSPTEEIESPATDTPGGSISQNPGQTSDNSDKDSPEEGEEGNEEQESVGNNEGSENTDGGSGGNDEGDEASNGGSNNGEPTKSDGSFQELPQETGAGEEDGDGGNAHVTSASGVVVIPMATSTLADGVITTVSLEPTATGDGTMGDVSGDRSGLGDSDDPMSPSSANSSSHKPPTGTIVGGAVGGAAAVALLIFLVWLLRRRRSNKSSLGSPEFERGLPGRAEKTWEFDTGSLGPTPRTTKFAAAISRNVGKIGKALGGSPSRNSINMNRGNSQFFMGAPPVGHNRSGSALDVRASEVPSVKGRARDWWSRAVREPGQASTEAAYHAPRPMEQTHSANNSVSEYSGGLGLALRNSNTNNNNNVDPFSDTNAVRPLRPARPPRPDVDPFADPEGIRPPSSIYHRSRGESLSQPLTSGVARSPSPPSRQSSVGHYTGIDRPKFRSDPFDLELSVGSTMRGSGGSGRDSYTSRVSSLDDWSDPGPDVGASMAGRGGIGRAS